MCWKNSSSQSRPTSLLHPQMGNQMPMFTILQQQNLLQAPQLVKLTPCQDQQRLHVKSAVARATRPPIATIGSTLAGVLLNTTKKIVSSLPIVESTNLVSCVDDHALVWCPDLGTSSRITGNLGFLQQSKVYSGYTFVLAANGNQMQISHTSRSIF